MSRYDDADFALTLFHRCGVHLCRPALGAASGFGYWLSRSCPGRAAARAVRSVQTTYYSICAWCSADPGSILTSGAGLDEWVPVLQRSVLVSLTRGRGSSITLHCARDRRVCGVDRVCGGLAA